MQNSIVAAVNRSEMIVPDESGWRVGGEGAWLWTAATTGATCYWVADGGRGFEEACQVMSPEYSGVMVREGWAPYRRFEKATHQSCLAHLLRRCDELTRDLPPGARGTPRRVRELLTEALCARDLEDAERVAVVDDLAATNWRAEQAIRPAVVNRKVWGGNRTWRGAATHGRMMSVVRTAAQQGGRRHRLPHPHRSSTHSG